MRYIVIYDISDDNLRNSIAKKLEDYGLTRIQFSSFIGNLPRFRLSALVNELRELIKGKTGERRSIIIYPLCDSCYSKGILIETKEVSKEDVVVF